MPSIFEGVYRQSSGIAGLHYLALGLGIGTASQINACTMDRVYRYLKLQHEGAGRPEYRLRMYQPIPLINSHQHITYSFDGTCNNLPASRSSDSRLGS